jgi:non-ribosomal peptide synthase protein (TIGR01720 family)
MNTHRAVAHHMSWMQAAYPLHGDDVVLQKTPYAFDASVWELFSPLLYGAPLVLARPDGHRDPAYLEEAIARHGVTVVQFVPSLLSLFMEIAEPARCASLRRVFCGGEALPPTLVARVHAQLSAASVSNLYGPTETAIDVSHWLCEPAASSHQPVPIGCPIANTQLYVLDPAQQPLPIGIAGELYVGGVQVGRGYLNGPGLTASRFVPDPFATDHGGRLYRTGDRVRRRADGTLEFLGRLDTQVKIRGIRIEPGEVEAALASALDLRDARVIVREDAPGEPRLVAYVVGPAPPEGLRAHLRRTLPDAMMPAAFVHLDRLPLMPNGKLDAKALPTPVYSNAAAIHLAPRTPTEEVLAGIWREVLRIDRVGAANNFFALGGDSILAIQVASRARRAGLPLNPRQVFETQTVAELAALVDANTAPPIDHTRTQQLADGSVPLTPIQAWFFDQAMARPSHFNQSMLFAVDAAVADAMLTTAVAAVLAYHDALRLRFRFTATGCEQRYAGAAESAIALKRVDLAALSEDMQDRAQEDAASLLQASLNMDRGPVGAAMLFDRGPRGRVLLLILHHLVVDGVSWRILRDDLDRACAQLLAGTSVDLGPKSSSYRQWADALITYAARPDLLNEVAYWQAQGLDAVPTLPRDSDSEGQSDRRAARARRVTVRLTAAETRALLQDVPSAYRTQIDEVLLCALVEAVGKWTGRPRVRLAMESHGREEEVAAGVDLTRTVGWFTSMYPLVLDTTGASNPGAQLTRVKEQMRALPRRGVGYGVLRYLHPDAAVRQQLATIAEPEIVFNYLGQFDHASANDASRIRFVSGRRGPEIAAENQRSHLLTINGAIRADSLHVDWIYSDGIHRQDTIERVASVFIDALRALITHCQTMGAGAYTPSDFPLAALSQDELNAVIAGRRAGKGR